MMAANSPESLDDILRIQRESFMQDGEASIQTRIDRVERCVDFLIDNQDAIVEATKKDWIHKPDSFIKAVEIIPVINHAKSIKKNLKNWMKDEVRKPDFPFNLMGAKTYIKYQALGVVGVMVPWNGPLAMAIRGTFSIPISASVSRTDDIWPLPPSIRTRSGHTVSWLFAFPSSPSGFSARLRKRRLITSRIMPKSSLVCAVLMLNLRYWPFTKPSGPATIMAPTALVPETWLLS